MPQAAPSAQAEPTYTKYVATITYEVVVEIDESKFDAKMMEEFRKDFYHFTTIEDHAAHLAFVQICDGPLRPDEFVEGYGPLNEHGIRISKAAEVVEEFARKVGP